jgi:hypothetical protein
MTGPDKAQSRPTHVTGENLSQLGHGADAASLVLEALKHHSSEFTTPVLKQIREELRKVEYEISQRRHARFLPIVSYLEHGSLHVRHGQYGPREVRLTLRDVKAGNADAQMREKVLLLGEEINARLAQDPNCPEPYRVNLQDLEFFLEFDSYKLKLKGGLSDVSLQFTPLVADSFNRFFDYGHVVRFPPFQSNTPSQVTLLEQYGLKPVAPVAVFLGTYLYRLFRGFPQDPSLIGTEHDHGDLLCGKKVNVYSSTDRWFFFTSINTDTHQGVNWELHHGNTGFPHEDYGVAGGYGWKVKTTSDDRSRSSWLSIPFPWMRPSGLGG